MADQFKIGIVSDFDPAGTSHAADAYTALGRKGEGAMGNIKTAVDKLDVSHREQRELLHLVGEQFGELGSIARFALNWEVLLVAALGQAISKAVEHHNELKKVLAESPDMSGFQSAIEEAVGTACTKAFAAAEVAASAFQDKLEAIAGAQTTLKRETDAAVESVKRQQEEEKKLIDLQEKRALAELKLKEQSGQVTAAQAAAERARIEDRMNARRGSVEPGTLGAEIEARKQELAMAQTAPSTDSVTKANADAQEKLKGAQAAAAEAQKNYDKQKDYVNKNAGALAETGKSGEEDRKLNLLGIQLIHYQDAATDAEKAANTAKSELATAQENAAANVKLINDLKREIPTLESRLAEVNQNRATEDAERHQTATAERAGEAMRTATGAAAGRDISGAESTAQAVASHQSVSDEAKKQLIDVASVLAGGIVTLQGAVAVMSRVSSNASGAESTAQAVARHQSVSDEAKKQLIDVASVLAGGTVTLQGAVAVMTRVSSNASGYATALLRLVGLMEGTVTHSKAVDDRIKHLEAQMSNVHNH